MDNRNTALLDGRFGDNVGRALEARGFRVVLTQPEPDIAVQVAYHPDMQICDVGRRQYVCSPNSIEFYRQAFMGCNIEIVQGVTVLQGQYPKDTAYNIARVGNCALMNTSSTDPVARQMLAQNGVKIIHIPQGYARCSICTVGDNAIITSDEGIIKAAKENNIKCLQISSGHITLQGYDYGFIGGASGLLNKDTLAFAGNIAAHPYYQAIIDFCSECGVQVISLTDLPLTDVGSIMIIRHQI